LETIKRKQLWEEVSILSTNLFLNEHASVSSVYYYMMFRSNSFQHSYENWNIHSIHIHCTCTLYKIYIFFRNVRGRSDWSTTEHYKNCWVNRIDCIRHKIVIQRCLTCLYSRRESCSLSNHHLWDYCLRIIISVFFYFFFPKLMVMF